MKKNWFWWFERIGWFVAGLLTFVTYRLINHWAAFLIWPLACGIVVAIFDSRPPRHKPASEAYAEYLERQRLKNEQKRQAKAQKRQKRQQS